MRCWGLVPVYGFVCESAVALHHGRATAAAAWPRAALPSSQFSVRAAIPAFERSMLARQITAASAACWDCDVTGVSAPAQLERTRWIWQRTRPRLDAFWRTPLHSTEADWPGLMYVS